MGLEGKHGFENPLAVCPVAELFFQKVLDVAVQAHQRLFLRKGQRRRVGQIIIDKQKEAFIAPMVRHPDLLAQPLHRQRHLQASVGLTRRVIGDNQFKFRMPADDVMPDLDAAVIEPQVNFPGTKQPFKERRHMHRRTRNIHLVKTINPAALHEIQEVRQNPAVFSPAHRQTELPRRRLFNMPKEIRDVAALEHLRFAEIPA